MKKDNPDIFVGKLIETIGLLQKQIEALSIKLYNLDCKVDSNYNKHHGKTFYWREPKDDPKL